MAFASDRPARTVIGFGMQINAAANTTYTLPRQGYDGNGTVATYFVPFDCHVTQMSVVMENVTVEWTAGTVRVRLFVSNVASATFDTGALALASYTNMVRPDGITDARFTLSGSVAIAAGSYLNVQYVTSVGFVGGADAPIVDVYLEWD